MKDQDRIEMTAANCEVLRARLAKYEDADGNPISTIAEQAREIASLRSIISECAAACGAVVSVQCSEGFMAMLPDEIRSAISGKSRQIERLQATVDGLDRQNDYLADDLSALTALTASAPNHSERVRAPDGWKVERGFNVLDKQFRFVDSKSHLPTIKIILPACSPEDMAAFDVRDKIAESVCAMLAAAPSAGSQGGDL